MRRERLFMLHLHCLNCQRPTTQNIFVPVAEGSPTSVSEFVEMLDRRPVRFSCKHCESLIANLVGVTMQKEIVMSTSAEVSFYVVQVFDRQGRRLVAAQPRQAKSAEHAKLLAERLAPGHAGVIAFSRTGDPDTGDFDDPVFLARFGDVPSDEELAA